MSSGAFALVMYVVIFALIVVGVVCAAAVWMWLRIILTEERDENKADKL